MPVPALAHKLHEARLTERLHVSFRGFFADMKRVFDLLSGEFSNSAQFVEHPGLAFVPRCPCRDIFQCPRNMGIGRQCPCGDIL